MNLDSISEKGMEFCFLMIDKTNICYLCGQKLKENIDFDYVPPKQVYAKSIRKIHSPDLLRLLAHKSCHARALFLEEVISYDCNLIFQFSFVLIFFKGGENYENKNVLQVLTGDIAGFGCLRGEGPCQ
jgi:hypothetical protein